MSIIGILLLVNYQVFWYYYLSEESEYNCTLPIIKLISFERRELEINLFSLGLCGTWSDMSVEYRDKLILAVDMLLNTMTI